MSTNIRSLHSALARYREAAREQAEALGDIILHAVGEEQEAYLTPQACAERLGIAKSTLRRWARDGRLVDGYHFTGNGRGRRFIRSRIQEWQETRSIPLHQSERSKAPPIIQFRKERRHGES